MLASPGPAAAPAQPGPAAPDDPAGVLLRRTRILFLGGLLLLLAHAFIPLQEFIHRGDDAYYYFKVAINEARLGFWTFDGIHASNGVQPLWGFVLSVVAKLLFGLGITDLDTIARVFVGLTAVMHFTGCMLLFHLLRSQVSLGAGIAAAGAFLFSMGIVWTRVWGMENSLFSVLLLSSVLLYQRIVRDRDGRAGALGLGLLLGLTVLCRLNAVLFVAVLLGHHVLRRSPSPRLARLRTALVSGIVSVAVVLPVLLSFYLETGHALPVAGGAKLIRAQQFLEAEGVSSVFSGRFLRVMHEWAWPSLRWWLTSRAFDGTWLLGGRLLHTEQTSMWSLAGVLALLLLAPLAVLRPGAWWRLLAGRLGRLRPLAFLLVFALLDATLSLTVFPYEARYSIIRWWMLAGELVVTVLVATLAATSLEAIGMRVVPARARLPLATAGLALLVGGHLLQMGRFYWDGTTQHPDWNKSNNEVRYAAARWLHDHLPPEARIGSWNAGVIGYYSDRQVINLDGLINDWDFLAHLESRDLAGYLEKEDIRYLADTNLDIRERGGAPLRGRLRSRSLYREYMTGEGKWPAFREQYFHIYEILEIVDLERAPGSEGR